MVEKFNVYSRDLQDLLDYSDTLCDDPDFENNESLREQFYSVLAQIDDCHLLYSTDRVVQFEVQLSKYSVTLDSDTLEGQSESRHLFIVATCDETPDEDLVEAEFRIHVGQVPSLGKVYSDGYMIQVEGIHLTLERFEELLKALREPGVRVCLGLTTEAFIPKDQEFLTRVVTFNFSEERDEEPRTQPYYFSLN